MKDLLLDSISEKLLAIDQKTTEIVKTTGETNRSIDQIRSRLSALESIKIPTIREIQAPKLVEPKVTRPIWSIAPDNKMRQILIPILIALGTMVALSFVLTAGLRTSLLLPYLKLPNETTVESPASSKLVNKQRFQKRPNQKVQTAKTKKSPTNLADSAKLPVQP